MTAYYQPQLPLDDEPRFAGVPDHWRPFDVPDMLRPIRGSDLAWATLAADWTGTGPRCTHQHKNGQCTNPIFGGYTTWEFWDGEPCPRMVQVAWEHFAKGRCPECANK